MREVLDNLIDKSDLGGVVPRAFQVFSECFLRRFPVQSHQFTNKRSQAVRLAIGAFKLFPTLLFSQVIEQTL